MTIQPKGADTPEMNTANTQRQRQSEAVVAHQEHLAAAQEQLVETQRHKARAWRAWAALLEVAAVSAVVGVLIVLPAWLLISAVS